MKTGEHTNEHGVRVTEHICDTCGEIFTICPGVDDWASCLADECVSYDPEHDIDVLFMSDAEVSKKPVVSMDMLRKRKRGIKLTDGTYAANLGVLGRNNAE